MTGIVLLAAAAGMSAYLDQRIRVLTQIEPSSATQPVRIDSSISTHGLEVTLSLLAADAATPIAVDEVTTLARIEAVGPQLRRTYDVNFEGMRMTDEFRGRIRTSVCAWPVFEPILRAGGSIRETYVENGGREIGSVIVTRDQCGFSTQ